MSRTHNYTQTKTEHTVDELWVNTILFDQSVDSIEVPFQWTEFDLEALSQEGSLMMVIKEWVSALRSRRQKPNNILFDYPNQSKILRILLHPQNSHTVIWIIHLILLFASHDGRIEIVFNDIHFVAAVSFNENVIVLNKILFSTRSHVIPNVYTISFFESRWERIILNEENSGQSNVVLFEFLMDDKTLIIVCYDAKNVTLVEACLTHNMSNDFKIRIKTNGAIKINNSTDIINIYARLPSFSINILGKLMHIVN